MKGSWFMKKVGMPWLARAMWAILLPWKRERDSLCLLILRFCQMWSKTKAISLNVCCDWWNKWMRWLKGFQVCIVAIYPQNKIDHLLNNFLCNAFNLRDLLFIKSVCQKKLDLAKQVDLLKIKVHPSVYYFTKVLF